MHKASTCLVARTTFPTTLATPSAHHAATLKYKHADAVCNNMCTCFSLAPPPCLERHPGAS